MMFEIVRCVSAISVVIVLIQMLIILDRNDKAERDARMEAKKLATTKSVESWARTYDFTVALHNKETASLNAEINALHQQIDALERQLATWNMIGETTKLREAVKK